MARKIHLRDEARMSLLLTDREREVMGFLWKRDGDGATVAEAREAIDPESPYTSVLTVFQVLEEKGHVEHIQESRHYVYFALTTRQQAQEKAIEHLVEHVYDGRTDELVKSFARVVADSDG